MEDQMANKKKADRHSEGLGHHLKPLREDYARVAGKRFEHFFCPMLLEDKPVPLCMGHIISEACPNSFRGRVPQRADVDNFYGSFVEAEFTTNVQARSMSLNDALLDPFISKKLCAKIIVNGEEWKHYLDKGVHVPSHSRIAVRIDEGEPLRLVVKKTQAEIEALENINLELRIGKDCRLEGLVSLIKAAYLTLFKLLGYSYALFADGRRIGGEVLGKFFKEHGHREKANAKQEALSFFRPYVNMMRTIEGFEGIGTSPVGTIEDGLGEVCVTPGGEIFGLVTFIRTNKNYFAVMMPYFQNHKGMGAYDNFLQSNDQAVRVHKCKIDAMRLIVEERTREYVWPKNNLEFTFDS
jgi:hypothetical protein